MRLADFRGRVSFILNREAPLLQARQGTLEKEKELKVEMVLQREIRQQVIQALRTAHPYEEPAFGLIDIITS